jgi:hypothetical protein
LCITTKPSHSGRAEQRGRRRLAAVWFSHLGQRKTPWDAIKTKTMIRTTPPITHPKTFQAWADE